LLFRRDAAEREIVGLVVPNLRGQARARMRKIGRTILDCSGALDVKNSLMQCV